MRVCCFYVVCFDLFVTLWLNWFAVLFGVDYLRCCAYCCLVLVFDLVVFVVLLLLWLIVFCCVLICCFSGFYWMLCFVLGFVMRS